ncbi:MAG TPA: DUF481 domain-containing protein [Lacunisphaera sp.]|nr:DUF481 domain-containing protein [Lacunisphaera sp.]
MRRSFLFPRFCFILLFALAVGGGLRAAEPEVATRDTLVYKDGDRIHGRLLEQVGDTLVFRSDRFGELRVPADQAVVIKADPSAAAAAAATQRAPAAPVTEETAPLGHAAKAAERAEAASVSIWELFSPAVLTAKVRDYFGPWHGRVGFAAEAVTDTTDRQALSVELGLKRKWKSDEVQLNGRQEYSQTSERTTTDLVKADGLWRHDFSKTSFIQYRPTVEWNRASFRGGVPNDYVLLQQEIGAGVNLLATPARKLRAGLSENLFDVWTVSAPAEHNSRTAESVFAETELKLPWGLSLTNRGVYYYSFSARNDGWENKAELTKKFTETLSTAIRHEMRRGSPDGTAQDYTRLRLLLGLDF